MTQLQSSYSGDSLTITCDGAPSIVAHTNGHLDIRTDYGCGSWWIDRLPAGICQITSPGSPSSCSWAEIDVPAIEAWSATHPTPTMIPRSRGNNAPWPPEGCGSLADQGVHEYADWQCECCGRSICWNCAVTVRNDGTGEGPIVCQHCGSYGGEYGRN